MMKNAAVLWAMSLAVLAAGAWLVCPHGQCAVSTFDQLGLGFAYGMRNPTLDSWMEGVTWLGSLAVLGPLAAMAVLAMWRHQRRLDAMFVVVALLGAAGVSHLAKLLVQRPRPDLYPVWTSMPLDWSYPSAHAMQIAAFACAMLFVIGWRRVLRAAVLASAVMLVGWSRLYLQVHFPSDVLAGALAAALWVGGLHALMFRRASDRSNITHAGGRT